MRSGLLVPRSTSAFLVPSHFLASRLHSIVLATATPLASTMAVPITTSKIIVCLLIPLPFSTSCAYCCYWNHNRTGGGKTLNHFRDFCATHPRRVFVGNSRARVLQRVGRAF